MKKMAKAIKAVSQKAAEISARGACFPTVIYQPKCPKQLTKKVQ